MRGSELENGGQAAQNLVELVEFLVDQVDQRGELLPCS